MDTLEHLLPVPERSFFLLGVRGTRKTTWARRNFTSALCGLICSMSHCSMTCCVTQVSLRHAGGPQAPLYSSKIVARASGVVKMQGGTDRSTPCVFAALATPVAPEAGNS